MNTATTLATESNAFLSGKISDHIWIARRMLISTALRTVQWESYRDDRNDVKKRFNAVRRVLRAIPLDTEIPAFTVYAPSFLLAGSAGRASEQGAIPIYLAPMLEFERQAEVNFTVAHEFAHLVLRHGGTRRSDVISAAQNGKYQKLPHEIEANALAESWGFKQPRTNSNWGKLRDIAKTLGYTLEGA